MLENLRRFLDGDERHAGVTPWDFEAGVRPPPGFELHYHPETKTLLAQHLEQGSRFRFFWDGYRWREEDLSEPEAPEVGGLHEALWELTDAIRSLESRVAKIERLLAKTFKEEP